MKDIIESLRKLTKVEMLGILAVGGILFLVLGFVQTLQIQQGAVTLLPGGAPWLRAIGGFLLTASVVLWISVTAELELGWLLASLAGVPFVIAGILFIFPHTTPPPLPLIVADFDNCDSVNNLGGHMGAAYSPPDKLEDTYESESGRDCVVKLAYTIEEEWSAFWMKLKDQNLRLYRRLVFDVRAGSKPPDLMKIELKRSNQTEVAVTYVSGITNDWQTKSVKLSDFSPTGGPPLSSLTQMEELVFVFEVDKSGPKGTEGVIYLDNVVLKP